MDYSSIEPTSHAVMLTALDRQNECKTQQCDFTGQILYNCNKTQTYIQVKLSLYFQQCTGK